MTSTEFDTTRRFVRVLTRRANGLVEFEFAVGEPDMYVELIMPKAAFDEFCAANRVALIGPRPDSDRDDAADGDEFRWTLRDATSQRLR